MAITPDNLLQRLEELRKWQEQQHQILLDKQVSQRELLNMEKQKLYEMFGLSISSEALNWSANNTASHIAEEQQDDGIEMLDDTESDEIAEDPVAIVHEAIVHTTPPKKSNDPPVAADIPVNDDVIPKRTFLKRGQGLQARFKVNPDQFRLDKLPKYKYANKHRKNTIIDAKNKQKPAETKTIDEPLTLSPPIKSKIIKNVPGELQLKKALHIPSKTLSVKQHSIDQDVMENFDKLCTKQIESNSRQSILPSNNFQTFDQRNKPLTWSNVLDPQNIEPISVVRGNNLTELQDTPTRNRVLKQQQEIDDLNIFELIEQNSNQSGLSNSSYLQRFLKQVVGKPLENEIARPDDPIVSEKNVSKQQRLIQPFPFDIQQKIVIDESECETIIDERDSYDDDDDTSDSEPDEHEKEQKQPATTTAATKQVGIVRFACKNDVINEIDSECETIMSTDIDDIDLSKTSTPNTKAAFDAFKAKVFGKYMLEETPCHEINESNPIDNNNTRPSNNDALQIELKKNIELNRQRLEELEKEIIMFRQQNAALIKAKQDHELDKIQLNQERQEFADTMNDERIKMEVYLHDERMKIAEENAKIDKRTKDLRAAPNRKDREEITKLRERVTELEKELANRDQKHVAAQGRLRAQLRTMEKDLKEYSYEIDNLRKENKKCESENIRLRRQGNNKLLQEINKNIAKLAPTTNDQSNKDESPPTLTKQTKPQRSNPITNQNSQKPILAKVISHRNDNRVTTIRSSKSVPNLVVEKTEEPNDVNITDSDSDDSCENDHDTAKSSAYFQNDKPRKQAPIPLTETCKINESVAVDQTSSNSAVTDESQSLKREILNKDGSKDIWYPNGNLKKISADSMLIRMLYFNKDIKETNINEGTVKYYYADTNTWQTSYLDGLEILEFPK